MYGQEHWIGQFEKMDALWIHDGDPLRPHAELTSGMHSSGFFNASLVTEHAAMLQDICDDLLTMHIFGLVTPSEYPKTIVGSAFGSITFASEFARQLRRRAIFTESGGFFHELMQLKRFSATPGELAMLVDDVLSTGGTLRKTYEELKSLGAAFFPKIFVLVNRSGLAEWNGFQVAALITRELPMWNPSDCPLCKAGSKALRPKANWKELTGK